MQKFEARPVNNEAQEKKVLWDKTIGELNRVADKLGKPIDAGVKEAVAAFTVNKFPTYGSCEGHVEERFNKKIKLRPYIAVGLEEPPQRFIGESEIKERIATQQGVSIEKLDEELYEGGAAGKAYWNYIQKQNISETPEYLAIRSRNEELQKSIQGILDSFYQNRQVNNDTKLITKGIGPAGHFRVTTAKENPKEVREEDVARYQQQLMAEQEEIKAFTKFLKERFFGK